MRRTFYVVSVLFLTLSASAQFTPPPGGVGVGASNVVGTCAGTGTSCAVTVTTLGLTSATVNTALIQCFVTSTGAQLAVTSFATTGTAPVTTITPSFTSTTGTYCTVNSNGGQGATGATGPAGPAPSGTGVVTVNSGTAGAVTVSGDGTLNPSTGALAVTQTGGTPFAASATTNALNASNISSGTLAAARVTNPLNQSTTGNAATATNLASYPALCSGGQFAQGLSAGSNNCGTPSGSGTVTASGSPVSGNIAAFTSATNITPATVAQVIALWSTCSGVQYLGADGACHNASGAGTVTSVTGTAPLQGTVTTSGALSCPACINTATPPLVISTATTIYVCPSALSNCAYNGDGGQAATPSDSNTYAQAQNKATPFASVTHAAAVLANALLLAPMTVQLADTSTSCYTDNEVIFNQQTSLEGNPYNIFEIGWSQIGGPYAYTDTYPTSYLEIMGNITTPTNVSWTGGTVPCAGATSGARAAMRLVHMNAVVHGINFKYFDANNADNGAVTAIDHSRLFMDHNTLTGSGGTGSYMGMIAYESLGFFGPSLNATEGGIIYCNLNSLCTTRTPAGWFSTTVTNNTYANSEIGANEQSRVTIWGPTTMSFLGTGAYTIYGANSNASIITNEANAVGASAITLNGANIRFLSVGQGGYIVAGCQSGGNTCTLTSFKQHASVSGGGVIEDNVGTQGTTADVITGGGQILYSAFSSPTGTFLSPTVKASVGVNSPLYQGACTAAPGSPASGNYSAWCDSTDLDWELKNSAGVIFKGFLSTGDANPVTGVVSKINGTSLAGLATGILKNTTITGVPSIAAAGTDYAPATNGSSGNILTSNGTGGNGTVIVPGAGVATALATSQGNGTKVQLSTGSTTTNDCVKFDANGNTVDNGTACGSGSGGGGLSGWSSNSPASFITTATQYAPFSGGGTTSGAGAESTVQIKASAAATIATIQCALNAALGAGASAVITLRDGSSSQTPICTISAGGTVGVASGSSFNIASGDLVDFQIAVSGTVTNATPMISIGYSVGTSGVGVTSVSATVPPQFAITGSPITASGTLALSFPALPNSYTMDVNSPFVQNTPIRRHAYFIINQSGAFASTAMGVAQTGASTAVAPTNTAPLMGSIPVANGSAVGYSDTAAVYSHRTGRTHGMQIECMGANTVITAVRSIVCGLSSTTLATSLALDVPGAFSMAYIVFSTTGVYTSGTDTTHYMLCTVNGTTQNCVSTGVAFDTSVHRFRVFEDISNSQWTGCVDGTCVNNSTDNPASGTNLTLLGGSYGISAASGTAQFAYGDIIEDWK